jgi:hypothetical protein
MSSDDDQSIFYESIESVKSELVNQIDYGSESESKPKAEIKEDIKQIIKQKKVNDAQVMKNFISGELINLKENKLIKNNINTEEKYGDDEMFESWSDNNLFFPIATRLIDPLKKIGLTPNMVTYLSNIFTFLSIYYFNLDNRIYASISYLIGYLLDCVDDKMARKYDMTSNFGMALDLVSNNVSNAVLLSFLIQKYGFENHYILLLIFMSYMITISYGLNEAIDSYKKTGSDNFLEKKQKELENEKDILYDLYLLIIKICYQSYKIFFPTYDQKKIFDWLEILKHFGPGNYCLLFSAVLLYIE